MKKDINIINVAGMDFTREAAVKILETLVSDIGQSLFVGVYATVGKDQSLAWRLDGDEERMLCISELIQEMQEEEILSKEDEILLADLVKYSHNGATDVVLGRGW